jgi:ribosomal protein L29
MSIWYNLTTFSLLLHKQLFSKMTQKESSQLDRSPQRNFGCKKKIAKITKIQER